MKLLVNCDVMILVKWGNQVYTMHLQLYGNEYDVPGQLAENGTHLMDRCLKQESNPIPHGKEIRIIALSRLPMNTNNLISDLNDSRK